MTMLFNKDEDQEEARFLEELEQALFSKTIARSGADLPPERIKALMRVWLIGSFNAHANGIAAPEAAGTMEWITNGEDIRLFYNAPHGMASCHLARIYRQPDNTWAAIVVAGVRNDPHSAMAAAEWAVSRLAA